MKKSLVGVGSLDTEIRVVVSSKGMKTRERYCCRS